MNNQGFNNQGFYNELSHSQGYQNPPPPIPFSNVNINQAIANSQKYTGESKKIL